MTDAELAHTKELAFWMTERVFMNPISAKLLNEDWRKAFPDEVAVAERMKALVVPEEMTPQQASRSYGGEVSGYRAGWNACRAAMLAAAPQPQNAPQNIPEIIPGWIPVSEQMPPSRHEVLVGRWWGEKPRWCCKWATYIPDHPDAQSSGWLIPGASWTPTHWMELPAGPKEVK